jgi:hypothetical protein
VTLSVMQALLGYTSEARWLRFAREHLGHLFSQGPGKVVVDGVLHGDTLIGV